MDQVAFVRMISMMAAEYYATPRSTEVPTPQGPRDLAKINIGRDDTWVLEDFGQWLVQRDDRTLRERSK